MFERVEVMKLVSDGGCKLHGMLERSEFDFWNVEITCREDSWLEIKPYFINITAVKVGWEIGVQQVVIKPSEIDFAKVKDVSGRLFVGVKITGNIKEDDEMVRL